MARSNDVELQRLNDDDVHWREIFNKYDSNGDGHISVHELQTLINAGHCRDIPRKVINQIMKIADIDNSGRLNYEEFLIMVNNPELKNHFSHVMNRYVNIFVPRNERRIAEASADGDYGDQYSCWPPAICLAIVSIVELTLYLIDAFADHTKGTGPIATQLIYNPHQRYEVWRYLTYMFVHIGSVHLVVNLIVQLILGIPLEMVHSWRILLVYLAGVVAGSLVTSITDPYVFLAGASGGVYALITAYLANLCINWSEMDYPAIQLLVFILIVGADFGTAIYTRYYLVLETNVGYVAHLAGAGAGLLVGIGVLRNLEEKRWEKYLWWCSIVSYFVLISMAVFMNLFWKSHFPSS